MLIATLAVFVLIVGIVAMLGTQLWVRPKAAIDRVTAAAVEVPTVSHPSLAWRERAFGRGCWLFTQSGDA